MARATAVTVVILGGIVELGILPGTQGAGPVRRRSRPDLGFVP
jgi:hypothetical protein